MPSKQQELYISAVFFVSLFCGPAADADFKFWSAQRSLQSPWSGCLSCSLALELSSSILLHFSLHCSLCPNENVVASASTHLFIPFTFTASALRIAQNDAIRDFSTRSFFTWNALFNLAEIYKTIFCFCFGLPSAASPKQLVRLLLLTPKPERTSPFYKRGIQFNGPEVGISFCFPSNILCAKDICERIFKAVCAVLWIFVFPKTLKSLLPLSTTELEADVSFNFITATKVIDKELS